MNPIIRSQCSHCGDIELSPSDVVLALDGSGTAGAYGFTCPICDRCQSRPASRRVVSLLKALKVDVSPPERPPSCRCVFPTFSAHPITEEEIERFVVALDIVDDWESKLRLS